MSLKLSKPQYFNWSVIAEIFLPPIMMFLIGLAIGAYTTRYAMEHDCRADITIFQCLISNV